LTPGRRRRNDDGPMTRSRYAIAAAATLLVALGVFFAARAISPSDPLAAPSASPASAAATTPVSPSPSPSPASPGTGGCSAAYSVAGRWPGGFQGQVVVTNTGSAKLSGWQLGWTFPGRQAINNLWDGSYTQSGGNVTVTSEPYNGALAPGASTTVGFTATYSGSNTVPPGVSCT
jgi:cellulase/cellobiase CelA1